MYVYLLFFSPLSHELFDSSPGLDGNFHLPQKNHPKTLLRKTEIIPKNSKQKEKQKTSQKKWKSKFPKVALCSEDIPLTDRRTRNNPHAAFKLMASRANPAGRLHSQESLVAAGRPPLHNGSKPTKTHQLLLLPLSVLHMHETSLKRQSEKKKWFWHGNTGCLKIT